MWTGVILTLAAAAFGGSDINDVLDRWLTAQSHLKTWKADCVQTRSIKSLTKPLRADGRVWFATPDRFRWELGQPPQTIAVRRGDEMWVSYPLLKRAEHYNLGGKGTGLWRDALALLEAGFPQSREQLDRQFKMAGLVSTNKMWTLTLQPKSSLARRFIAEVSVTLQTNQYALLATELTFADGSRMRNDFTNAVLNPKLDESLFNPPLDATYTVTEPLKQ